LKLSWQINVLKSSETITHVKVELRFLIQHWRGWLPKRFWHTNFVKFDIILQDTERKHTLYFFCNFLYKLKSWCKMYYTSCKGQVSFNVFLSFTYNQYICQPLINSTDDIAVHFFSVPRKLESVGLPLIAASSLQLAQLCS
jgi:hypothetical protein